MGKDDYGYFGKGTTGYAHYTQTHNRAFSGSKPTATSNKHVTPSSPTNIGDTALFAMMIYGTICTLLTGFVITLQILSYLQGWITGVEFVNETILWIIFFIGSLICSISGFRHFFGLN